MSDKAIGYIFGVACLALLVIAGHLSYKDYQAKPKARMVTSVSVLPVAVKPVASNSLVTTTKIEVIELTAANTVVMAQAFDEQSVSAVMLELQAICEKSPNVYLVLNTPGGSIDAGLRLISFIKGLNCRVKTLTLFAASMGFMTAQNLDERLILDTGTLMSHRAKFGMSGEADGELTTRYNWVMKTIGRLEAIAASRMGMALPAYKELIRDEYWVNGADAVADKAADREVVAKCGAGLTGTKHVDVATAYGTYSVELSKCPLVPGYISASPKNGVELNVEALRYVKAMFGSKRSFVNEYIVTNEWMKFQK